MIYLLDTNVISETIKPSPNLQVVSWLRSVSWQHCSLSVLTLGEIRKGIEKTQDNTRKQKLLLWLEIELPQAFQGKILDIDLKVADKWGYIASKNTMPVIDTLIAATALAYNQKLVTRNIKDFAGVAGLELVNPWE